MWWIHTLNHELIKCIESYVHYIYQICSILDIKTNIHTVSQYGLEVVKCSDWLKKKKQR